MSITFSGLASGVDTASIVESIIEIERAPIDALEEKQEYLETKLDTYTEFNDLVQTLALSVMGLNSSNDLASFEVSNNGSSNYSITTTSITTPGTYSVEVVSLAERQKDVSSEGFSDADETMLSGELQIGDETISYSEVTLTELAEMIDEGGYGLSASVINDGTDEGYRLLLTADSAGEEISITGTGDITIDTTSNGHTVDGSLAHAVVDGIDYYSSSNSLTSAIHGTTITLLQESESASSVTIASNSEETIAEKLEEIVAAFNTLNEYAETVYESDPTLGISLKNLQRGLKNYLTSSELVNLGISTEWETGELTFDSDVLAEAYDTDPDAVVTALLGDDETNGIMTRLDDYLTEQLDSSTGFLATKESSIDAQLSRLDDSITAMETRLEKRQETLEAQFTAMETLISSLNSQADYLESFFDGYNSSS